MSGRPTTARVINFKFILKPKIRKTIALKCVFVIGVRFLNFELYRGDEINPFPNRFLNVLLDTIVCLDLNLAQLENDCRVEQF